MAEPSIGNDEGFTGDPETDAFLRNLRGAPAEKPEATEESEEAGTEDTEQAPSETPSDDDTEGAEDGVEESGDPDPDDAEHEIKVGEETKKFKLSQLKRLAGQEAALTQRSQKVAEETKRVEAEAARTTAAMDALMKKAEERFAPYAQIDWFSLSRNPALDQEAFAQLRADAAAAEGDLKFLREELTGHVTALQQQAAKEYQTTSEATIKELTDPDKGIKGFGPEMYNSMMQWAESRGVQNARRVNQAPLIRLLHSAMQWETYQQTLKDAKAKVKAAPNKPTTTLTKGSKTPPNTNSKKVDAMKRLRADGRDEDAMVDAFMSTL